MTEDDKYKSIFLGKGAEEVLKRRPTELQRLTGILEFLGVFHNSANQVLGVNMPLSAPGPRVLPLRSNMNWTRPTGHCALPETIPDSGFNQIRHDLRAFLRPVSHLG